MSLKLSLINLKSKLSRSCNRFISFFHARFSNVNTTQSSTLLSCLCFLNTNNDQRMSQIIPRSSSSSLIGEGSRKMMFPLAKERERKSTQSDMLKEDAMKEGCRSLENYLIHMIVEEGEIDGLMLMDMEELLFYWKKLKSPIFIDIVTSFYGELCTDLFPKQP